MNIWQRIKNALFCLLSKDFIDSIIYNAFAQRSIEQRVECDRVEFSKLQEFVGKPIISFGNEWEDMFIGFGERIETIVHNSGNVTHMLVGKNYITMKEVTNLTIVFNYNYELLITLMKLTPYERWAIATKSNSILTKPHDDVVLLRFASIMVRLAANGFFASMI